MKAEVLRVVAAITLVGACVQAQAVPFSADFTVTGDNSGGRSFDADFAVSPTENFTLDVGAGQSTGSDETGNLKGTLANAGASLHGDRGGFSLGYDLFDDGSNYRATTIGGRAWINAGDFEFALLGRRRDLAVGLTLALPLRTVNREVDFSAVGAGLQVTYTGENWTAYAMGLKYDYDDDFDNFIALINSPELAQRPVIEALVGSFVTQSQGAIDRQAGIGIERSFGRHSLALDVASVHDAILDSGSASAAITWRYSQSSHVDWSLSGGMVDSDAYGNIGFLSIGVGLTR
jgi:hypothetical protein